MKTPDVCKLVGGPHDGVYLRAASQEPASEVLVPRRSPSAGVAGLRRRLKAPDLVRYRYCGVQHGARFYSAVDSLDGTPTGEVSR